MRSQIKRGADWIKLYADNSGGPNGETVPSFSQAELNAAVETARSSGRYVVSHARSNEGIDVRFLPVSRPSSTRISPRPRCFD